MRSKTISKSIRTGVLAAGVSAATAIALAGAAPAAHANADGCAEFENVCIAVFGGTGETVTIEGYAHSDPFHGHFELSGPGGLHEVGATDYWDDTPGDHDTFTVPGAATGNYCVSAYNDQNKYQGAACETVH